MRWEDKDGDGDGGYWNGSAKRKDDKDHKKKDAFVVCINLNTLTQGFIVRSLRNRY